MNGAYRALYPTAFRKYAMSVPFTERFFDLAAPSGDNRDAGFVGMITANSFMKREFGKKLIEQWLPQRDLTHVIDTSGAYIPGHGTPTVILFARNQPPQAATLRAVLGIRGEPGRPADPAEGQVWQAILAHVDKPGSEGEFVSVEDAERSRFKSHPWSLQGGSASEVLAQLSRQTQPLSREVTAIGVVGISGGDDVMLMDVGQPARLRLEPALVRPLVEGQVIRDWQCDPRVDAYFPYKRQHLVQIADAPQWARFLWAFRTVLGERATFSKKTYFLEDRPWWEWHQVSLGRLATPLSIVFAFVGTHNHFVLDRGGKVFKQSAPVVKLPDGATEDDHLRLLGLLNSSTACFWMKQVFHSKGAGGGTRVAAGHAAMGDEEWENHFEFDGTKLKQFPIPRGQPLTRARELDRLARELADALPAAVIEGQGPSRQALKQSRTDVDALRARMVALQEELDWECYRLYGLTDDELTVPSAQVPDLRKGERAFEIVLARHMARGETTTTWFMRHGSTPVTELPAHWPGKYRELVAQRIARIEQDRAIGLLERPEYKRRWNWEGFEDLQRQALKRWLGDRLEAAELWAEPALSTCARLADGVRRDPQFNEAAQLYAGRIDVDLTALVTELVGDEAVPFASHLRYKPSGLRKRREWEAVWDLQRAEDALDHLDEAEAALARKEQGFDRISVPPKYTSADFAKLVYWKLRGKLDVPRERFVLYPGTRLGADRTPVVGWAGWDHLGQARALAAHFTARKDEGAERDELVGLLAGLAELVPWLLQWHNTLDPVFGQRLGDFFAALCDAEARGLGRTLETVRDIP